MHIFLLPGAEEKSYLADSDDVSEGRKYHLNVCLRIKSVSVVAVLDAIGFDCKFTWKIVAARFSAMAAGRFSENPAARSMHTGMAANNVKPNRRDRRTRCADRKAMPSARIPMNVCGVSNIAAVRHKN